MAAGWLAETGKDTPFAIHHHTGHCKIIEALDLIGRQNVCNPCLPYRSLQEGSEKVLCHFLGEVSRAECNCTIIPFYNLTSLTPVVNIIKQIINVIKVDVSLNQPPDSSISSFVNNLVVIPNKPTAIRTYPVGFALILNPLIRPLTLLFGHFHGNYFGAQKEESHRHILSFDSNPLATCSFLSSGSSQGCCWPGSPGRSWP